MIIKELAKLAGLSVGTVSMALNNNPKVNIETKLKVKELAKKYNFYSDQSAKRLRTRKSGLIGVIVTKNSNPFFASLVDELDKCISNTSYTMLLGFSNDDVEREKKYVKTFISNQVEGFIIVPSDKKQDCNHLLQIKELNIPIIFATTAYAEIESDTVMTDLEQGEYILVDYLLKKGYKRIVFVNGYNGMIHFTLRTKGFIRAFDENNMNYSNKWFFETKPDYLSGYNLVDEILKEKPEAIITANDFLALGVMKRLLELNIHVPDDIGIAGYDDLLFSSLIHTPLTTVSQPVREISEAALKLLIDRIQNKTDKKATILLKPELIIRNSTK